MVNLSNRWVIIFLFLPHISIYYYSINPIKQVVFCLQFTVVIVSLFLLFKQLKTFNLLMIIYAITIIASAQVNGNLTPQVLFSTGILLGICIYLYHVAKTNFLELIKGLYYLLSFSVVLNFFTMVFMDGVATDELGSIFYLLGNKNAIPLTALPAIAISYLYAQLIYKKMKMIPFAIILISIISCYISSSGSGIVVSLMFTIFVLVPKKFLFSFRTYFIIYISLFFAIVVFRLQEVLFGGFIVDVLHKKITFTGRTYIWDFIFSNIQDSWLYGFGRGQTMILEYFMSNFNETHDGILELLMFTGVIGLLIFFTIVRLVGKRLMVDRENITTKVMSFSIFAFLIVSLTESVFNQMEFWLMLIIGYHINISVVTSEIVKNTRKEDRIVQRYRKMYARI